MVSLPGPMAIAQSGFGLRWITGHLDLFQFRGAIFKCRHPGFEDWRHGRETLVGPLLLSFSPVPLVARADSACVEPLGRWINHATSEEYTAPQVQRTEFEPTVLVGAKS